MEVLKELDLGLVPELHRKRLLTIMWDECLGEIGSTEHRVNQLPNMLLFVQSTYKAGQ